MALSSAVPTLLCFSHLRWNFVYQRPQHLLSRAAATYPVMFVEEPVYRGDAAPHLDIALQPSGVKVVTSIVQQPEDHRPLLDELFQSHANKPLILWYYTPMALAFSDHLSADLVVYDCMDELSAFKLAPPELKRREAQLFRRADVVFTGGHSLYQAKRLQHPNTHAFPSSVDKAHFAKARQAGLPDPVDQAHIPHPRVGFFGVIDERLDLDLVARMADLRPDLSFVMIGPVVKIDPQSLPQRPNIHWLGGRGYEALPAYLAHWDMGFMPFALNDSTRFISPTKTPEFLAAGLPVVSSAITDVVQPYGVTGMVEIAGTPGEFACAAEMLLSRPREKWLSKVDGFLADLSWDRTWEQMHAEMRTAMNEKRRVAMAKRRAARSKASVKGGEYAGV
jgi:glycosyltransferase involved in cell wall biosynthesis